MQRQGIVPNNASAVLNDFQQHFMSYEPQDERQKILAAEAYKAFNELTASRRTRLNSVTSNARTSVGSGHHWSCDLHRRYLVPSPGKFYHALLDDDLVFWLVGFADFSNRSSG